ncbi:MBL fold metallo-hydrolase [Streptosporangium sp. KLBMP 9127]|nr:MBL fold metallo-hydrolase [Streptosporangium sp. KLBMP 9127]
MAAHGEIEVIETSRLGDRGYLATDGEAALVVDPQRDIDRIIAMAGRLGSRITHVVETHMHNDYVSGGLELSRLTGAVYGVPAADKAPFDHLPLADGDVLEIGPARSLRVVATPGHTFHHLSYVLERGGGVEGVFTGGSLLFGTTGRTDLLGEQHARDLARMQYASVRKLVDALPGGTRVWPTHGFGSFCAASPTSGGDESTLARERLINPVLRLAAEEFVDVVLAGLDAYPAYYARLGAINLAGPEPLDLHLADPADPEEVRRRLASGEWVVDLRDRRAYADSHLAGTISLGLDGPMATWLGWLMEWGAPLTLIGEQPGQIAEARRELARIGVDRIAAFATGLAGDAALPVATFADLAAPPATLPHPEVVLDVRLRNEWKTSHIAGAVHIPLPELPHRLADVPPGVVWTHCGSGYRAAAAASLLTRAGRTAVLIDDIFDAAAPAGVPLA